MVKTAAVIRAGQERHIAVDAIQVNDLIKVRSGEKIVTDGVFVSGQFSVNEAMLTGEPMPVAKQLGAMVIGGSINQAGSFVFKATKIGKDTVLAQIIALVQQAQSTKPPIAHIADVVASLFVPAVVVIAIITAMIWLFYGPAPQASFMLLTAMSVLVISCPCALGLATPISVILGMGRAAEKGMLIKNGMALQQASKLTTIVFDKTGTLTMGKPRIFKNYRRRVK